MSDAAHPVRVADLLAHREWVSRVARALVRDADAAADLEQDLWVETLRRPPVVRASLRGWLATALRRDVLSLRRGAARRVRRETAAARPEAQPSTSEIVARAEAADRVMHAVLELDEPYRATILLRYVEGVELADIAATSGVSVETVRTRHKRALATLRGRLGGARGGDAWLAAVAPIVGWKAHAGSAATTTVVAGGTVMAAKAAMAAGVGLVLVAGFAGGRVSAATAHAASEARVAELVQRMELLDAKRPAKTTPSTTSVDERRVARERRLDAVESDLDAALAPASKRPGDVEAERRSALATPELLVETRQLVKVAKYTKALVDAQAVLDACALLLARRLTTDERAETLVLRGYGHEVLGDAADEEGSFREALKVADAASTRTEEALAALAFMAGRRGGADAAVEAWRRVADWHADAARRATTTAERAHQRYYAAVYLGRAKDTTRARDEFTAVVNEFGSSDDADVRKWADFSKNEIDKMDGKAPPPARKSRAR